MAKVNAEKAAAKAEKEAEKAAAKAGKDSATVSWSGGTRTYTRDIHGDDFLELAKEFAGKKGGTIVA